MAEHACLSFTDCRIDSRARYSGESLRPGAEPEGWKGVAILAPKRLMEKILGCQVLGLRLMQFLACDASLALYLSSSVKPDRFYSRPIKAPSTVRAPRLRWHCSMSFVRACAGRVPHVPR